MSRRRRRHRHHRPQLSLLVPFKPDPNAPERTEVWDWLERYWAYELPDAEIVIGRAPGKSFSKTQAVNDAARRAHGRIFVILDADAYLRGSVLVHCATAIEEAARRGHNLWFVPYRHLYRLTQTASQLVLSSDPRTPYRFHNPPPIADVEKMGSNAYGHRFGAMVQIMPREAFEVVGGMDTHFQGWGGEDVAFVRALDTLWGKHKTTNNEIYHLWHPAVGTAYFTRMWQGQTHPRANDRLASRYSAATGDRARMRALIDEGQRSRPKWMAWWTRRKGQQR